MHLILEIELGSTRIKSVLIDENANVLVQGAVERKSVSVVYGPTTMFQKAF